MKNNNDTSIRIDKIIGERLSLTKDLMETIDKRRYSKGDVINHMIDFILENDKDLKHMYDVVIWNKDRGRVTQLRG